jgi:hypothetical protein
MTPDDPKETAARAEGRSVRYIGTRACGLFEPADRDKRALGTFTPAPGYDATRTLTVRRGDGRPRPKG